MMKSQENQDTSFNIAEIADSNIFEYNANSMLTGNTPLEEKPKEDKSKIPRAYSSWIEAIEPQNIGELERKIIETEGKQEESSVEDVAEESFLYKENAKSDYLGYSEYAAEKKRLPNEFFQKTSYNFITEIKQWWYIKYRTVAQNLRNITLLRGMMSDLEHSGMTVVKKVK